MPHTRGLADAFGDSVNGRSGTVAGIGAALWNREDESAALSPLPDRREVFAAEGPKDGFGSCIVEHDLEPRGVLDPVTGHQARLIVDVDLPCITKPRAEGLCERLHQFLFKLVCLVLFHSRSFVCRVAQHLDRVTGTRSLGYRTKAPPVRTRQLLPAERRPVHCGTAVVCPPGRGRRYLGR